MQYPITIKGRQDLLGSSCTCKHLNSHPHPTPTPEHEYTSHSTRPSQLRSHFWHMVRKKQATPSLRQSRLGAPFSHVASTLRSSLLRLATVPQPSTSHGHAFSFAARLPFFVFAAGASDDGLWTCTFFARWLAAAHDGLWTCTFFFGTDAGKCSGFPEGGFSSQSFAIPEVSGRRWRSYAVLTI